MVKRLLANTLICVFMISSSFNSYALTLSIKSGQRNLRTHKTTGDLVVSKTLTAGTKITIPDEFIDKHYKGDKRDEVSLLNWLSSAQNLPLKSFTSKKKKKHDYFVPITVEGSGDHGWISLRTLARDKGLTLVTKEKTNLYKRVNSAPVLVHEKQKNVNDDCVTCDTPQKAKSRKSTYPSISKETLGAIAKVTNKLDRKAAIDTKNRGRTSHIIRNFNRTCKPTTFNQFIGKVRTIASRYKIPTDLLLGVMTQESSGRCDRSNHEQNGTYSAGLFQINTSSIMSKGVKRCGNAKRAYTSKYCLENPYVSLVESAKILASKYKRVNSSWPSSKTKSFKRMSTRQKDLWRKALAAYNGGEGWVIRAYKSIQAFNKRYNENLDPHNWHIRKIFMLRGIIQANGGQLLGKDYKARERTHQNTLSNLSYVEAITNSRIKNDQVSKWTSYID